VSGFAFRKAGHYFPNAELRVGQGVCGVLRVMRHPLSGERMSAGDGHPLTGQHKLNVSARAGGVNNGHSRAVRRCGDVVPTGQVIADEQAAREQRSLACSVRCARDAPPLGK